MRITFMEKMIIGNSRLLVRPKREVEKGTSPTKRKKTAFKIVSPGSRTEVLKTVLD